jgi:hypothetical protein
VCERESIARWEGIPFVRKKVIASRTGIVEGQNVCESPSKKEQQKETTEQVMTMTTEVYEPRDLRVRARTHARIIGRRFYNSPDTLL